MFNGIKLSHNAFQALQMAEFGIVNYQIRLKAKLISIFFSGFGFTRDMLSDFSLYGFTICHSTDNFNQFWVKFAPKHG